MLYFLYIHLDDQDRAFLTYCIKSEERKRDREKREKKEEIDNRIWEAKGIAYFRESSMDKLICEIEREVERKRESRRRRERGERGGW